MEETLIGQYKSSDFLFKFDHILKPIFRNHVVGRIMILFIPTMQCEKYDKSSTAKYVITTKTLITFNCVEK